jgi:hypothetical protein
MHFQNFSGEGLNQPLPRLLPHSISGCALDSSFAPILGRFALSIPGFALNSPPPKCLLIPPQQKGTRSNTVPQPQILVFPNTGPKITFQEYVVGLIYTIEKIIDSSYRLGELLENPLIQRR